MKKHSLAVKIRLLAYCWLVMLPLSCVAGVTPDVTPDGTRLVVGGYGYLVGDIVQLDTARQPAVGDIVQYDDLTNNSDFHKFGPGIYIARIVALPGDNVAFNQSSFKANGITAEVGGFGKTVWGGARFDNLAGMNLTVPENEFLVDKFIGYEWVGEQGDNSPPYRRFTIKREAIIGVITKKLGHDSKFEEEQKNIIY